jgi:hypothetical protein
MAGPDPKRAIENTTRVTVAFPFSTITDDTGARDDLARLVQLVADLIADLQRREESDGGDLAELAERAQALLERVTDR